MSDFNKLEKRYDYFDWKERWLWGFLAGWMTAWGCALIVLVVTVTR